MPRRVHSKISKLPPALRDAVNDLLVNEGKTMDEIVAFLKERGVEIGKSSVGRYSKNFTERLSRLREAKQQTEVLVRELSGRPATEMHEAANALMVQEIFEWILEHRDLFADADPVKAARALAELQKTTVATEYAKLKFQKEADERLTRASKTVGEVGKAKGLDEDVIREIQAKAFGIVPAAAKAVA